MQHSVDLGNRGSVEMFSGQNAVSGEVPGFQERLKPHTLAEGAQIAGSLKTSRSFRRGVCSVPFLGF